MQKSGKIRFPLFIQCHDDAYVFGRLQSNSYFGLYRRLVHIFRPGLGR